MRVAICRALQNGTTPGATRRAAAASGQGTSRRDLPKDKLHGVLKKSPKRGSLRAPRPNVGSLRFRKPARSPPEAARPRGRAHAARKAAGGQSKALEAPDGSARSRRRTRRADGARAPSPASSSRGSSQTRQSTSGGGTAPRGAGSALKRSRSLWKVRPLLIDEELPIFVEGRDDLALLAYDDGEFARWMQGVATGRESSAGAAPYPLIVQDPELRTILEIRGPSEDARGADAGGQARAGRAGDGPEAIAVPGVRVLPPEEQPDLMLERGEAPPVIQLRTGLADEAELGSADGVMPSGVAAPGVSTAAPLPPQLERDPPYSRYVQVGVEWRGEWV